MIITLTVFLVLLYCVVYKAKIYPELNPNFFDVKTTKCPQRNLEHSCHYGPHTEVVREYPSGYGG